MNNSAYLFIPGNNPGMINSAEVLAPGSVIFDLEDSIAPQDKDAARELVRKALHFFDSSPYTSAVRINPYGSPHWSDDIEAMMNTPVDWLLLPKSTLESVQATQELMANYSRPVGLWLLIESARGLYDLPLMIHSGIQVGAIMFGGEDYCSEMGLAKSRDRLEILYARQQIVQAAAVMGVPAVDTPFTDAFDTTGFIQDATMAKNLGFHGKLLIHPFQISLCQKVWQPSDDERRWAQSVIAMSRKQSSGVFRLGSEMIDLPVILRAKRIIDSIGEETE